MNLDVRDPPLFILTKQLEVEMDQLFYKVLEGRLNIKNSIVNHLKENYPQDEWSRKIITRVDEDELHMFMPFSH